LFIREGREDIDLVVEHDPLSVRDCRLRTRFEDFPSRPFASFADE